MTDRKEVEAKLQSARAALHKVIIGEKATAMSYDGKSMTYTPADETKLRRYIRELEIELGHPVRSRITSFRY